MVVALPTTVSIRIVADCVALFCQVTQKLERATTLEVTTEPAIIFILLCAALYLNQSSVKLNVGYFLITSIASS